MKSLKVAIVISYLTLILSNIVSLVYTPFMLSTLGSGEYGLFTLTNSIISYIYLLDIGFGNAVIRYNSEYIIRGDEDNRQKLNGMFLVLYSIIAVIGLLIGIIMYLNFDGWFASGLTLDEISRVKIMFCIAIINLVCAFPLNIFNGIITSHEKFIYIKVITLVRTILNPIIMISVLVAGYGAIGMLIGSTIFNISVGLINIIYCIRYLKVKFQFRGFKKEIFIEIFKYSFFIFLTSIAGRIYWSTDQFVLGMFVSSSAIAIYAIGSQFNMYFTSCSNLINSMFLPKLTKLTTEYKDSVAVIDIIVKVARIQYYIAVLILFGFVFIGKQFIMIWSGMEYESSYTIALLIMFPQLISIIQSLFATLLEAMNKHRVKSIIYLGVAIFNLILTLILVKPFGAIGCALATCIGMLINALLNNLYYKYGLKLEMKRYWNEIFKLFPASILSFLTGIILLKIINPTTLISIFIFCVIFTIFYVIEMWLFAMNDVERATLKDSFNVFKRIFKFKTKFNMN